MSLIKDILPIENILIDLEVSSKKRLFEYISTFFAEHYDLSAELIFQCLIAREKLGSTALGCGVTIPHGRLNDLTKTLSAFIRLKDPIDFDAPDDKPINIIFVLLVPKEATTEHLKVLSSLAEKFSNKDVRIKLKEAQTPLEISSILET